MSKEGVTISTSPCLKQLLNEATNDISVVRHQDFSVVRLHNILLERRDNILRGRNNDVLPVHLHDVSDKSQMKYPTTSQWYVTKTS